jgi:cbb3-type cytochrome oxidase maturation protein
MTDFLYLIPLALALGVAGLGAFLWSLRSGQYEDLDGAAERILFDDDDAPATDRRHSVRQETGPGPAPPP